MLFDFPIGTYTVASLAIIIPALIAGWYSVRKRVNELAGTQPLTGTIQVPVPQLYLSAAAWDEGFYDNLVAPVPGTDLVRDESIRPGSSAEKLAGLKTVFRAEAAGPEGGTVTAGNASPLSDGASAALIGSDQAFALAPVAGRCTVALGGGADPARLSQRRARSTLAVPVTARPGKADGVGASDLPSCP